MPVVMQFQFKEDSLPAVVPCIRKNIRQKLNYNVDFIGHLSNFIIVNW